MAESPDSFGEGPAPPETPEGERNSTASSDISLDSGIGDPVSAERAEMAHQMGCRPHDLRWSQRQNNFTFTQEYIWDHPEHVTDNSEWNTEEEEERRRARSHHSDYGTDEDRPRPVYREESPVPESRTYFRNEPFPYNPPVPEEDSVSSEENKSERDTQEKSPSPGYFDENFWQYPSDSGNEADNPFDSDSESNSSENDSPKDKPNTDNESNSSEKGSPKDKPNTDNEFNNKKRKFEPDSDSYFSENKRR